MLCQMDSTEKCPRCGTLSKCLEAWHSKEACDAELERQRVEKAREDRRRKK